MKMAHYDGFEDTEPKSTAKDWATWVIMESDARVPDCLKPLHTRIEQAIRMCANQRITELEAEVERLKEDGKLIPDHPDADGTDIAHPAWWRGHEHTTASFCQIVNQILDGKDDGTGVANEPWESTRRRLIGLRAEVERLKEEAEAYGAYVTGRFRVDWNPDGFYAMSHYEPSTHSGPHPTKREAIIAAYRKFNSSANTAPRDNRTSGD